MIELRRRNSGSKGSDSPSFSRLPNGYQEVEYLESNKGLKEYLLINIFNKVGDVIEFTAQLMELVGSKTFFGAVDDVGDYRFGLGATTTNYVLSVNNTSKILNSKITYAKTLHKLEWKEDYFNFYIDNTLVSQEPNKQLYTELANQMPIFAAYYRKAYVEHIWMRLFSFKVYREGNLHIDLIPCYRISDRVAGMYDIVNDVFYTNAGTGEFIVGPDVHYNIPFEYQEVEYLENVNNSYLILDIYPQKYDKFEIDINIPQILSAVQTVALASKDNRNFGLTIGNISLSSKLVISANGTYGLSASPLITNENIKLSCEWGDEIKAEAYQNGNKFIEYSVKDQNKYTSIDCKLPIFSYYTGSETGEFGKFKCSGFRYYRGGNKIADIIPCYRKADNVAGMYDVVNNIFYTNAGTGEFIVGPDIID